jgi:hypothetical protein
METSITVTEAAVWFVLIAASSAKLGWIAAKVFFSRQ